MRFVVRVKDIHRIWYSRRRSLVAAASVAFKHGSHLQRMVHLCNPSEPTMVHTLRHPPPMLLFQFWGFFPSVLPLCQTRLCACAQHTAHTLCSAWKCSQVDLQLSSVLCMIQCSTTALVRYHYRHKKNLF